MTPAQYNQSRAVRALDADIAATNTRRAKPLSKQDQAALDSIAANGTAYATKSVAGNGQAGAFESGAAGDPSRTDRDEALKRARKALQPSLKGRDAPAYPVDALGALAPVCKALSEGGQMQGAMAGQCLLGAVSLLTQGLFNVQTLNGKRPLSLYLLTLGDSGDGKSSAQDVALAPVNEWQRGEAERYRQGLKDFEEAKATRKRNTPRPEVPPCPFRLCSDSTVEGLRRDLDSDVCAQGIFTDEAAAILSGYGMSPDHRAKTAGVFSKLWDHGHLSVSRATGGGRIERYGRRIALHWLIQPMAASESIGDPMLSALGFWPRFLAAWPEPQASREARPFEPAQSPPIAAYWRRCNELLAYELPDDADSMLVLGLDADAKELLSRAFEGFEREARLGSLQAVKPFALRASEQACRIAGVMAAYDGKGQVTAETMSGALALAAYSMKTWMAIIDEGAADPRGAWALRLYEWLTLRPGWEAPLTAILHDGPANVRAKARRDDALSVLEAAGLVLVLDGKAYARDAP
jgi:Protein of unknown function (DUF3987)